MKKLLLLTLTIALLGIGCNKLTAPQSSTPTLTVYAYESLNADYGLLPLIIPEFEQNYNVTVNVVTFSDAGVMLNQLIAEQDNPKADVVVGLDNLQAHMIENNALVKEFIAFDYGYVAFVYDSEKLSFPEPISLMNLTDPAYKDQIIIEQPGLSSPGTQLLAWVQLALDEQAGAFWNAIRPNLLSVAPDWNTAYYSMFLTDQAPIVLSYITSPAYHEIEENSTRYKVIPIKEGYMLQTEGMGVVTGAVHEDRAQNFVEFMQTKTVQDRIATTQWMYPILEAAQTPPAFEAVRPTEEQTLKMSPRYLYHLPTWLSQWNSTFGN